MKICVFCGGAGTRMWPLSRRNNPKQFQPLIEEKSLFQLMIERLEKGFGIEDIYVVTGREYKSLIRKQVPNLPKNNLILEPEMRDTAAAVGYAAAHLQDKFPGETMAAIWGADHTVKKDREFIKSLKLAEKIALREGVIVKVDVRPTFPSVNLGYVQIGKKIKEAQGLKIYEFVRHVEKPKLNKAKAYLKSGKYLWNTGYLVWKISTIMGLYEKHTPEIYYLLKKARENRILSDKKFFSEYRRIPRLSIDYALFEKLRKGDQLIIEADLGWTDVGAWSALKDELKKDKNKNVVEGKHIGIDTEGCLIHEVSKKKLIATVGLKGMIVVDTKDSLLICPASRSADVKKIVSSLRKAKKDIYL